MPQIKRTKYISLVYHTIEELKEQAIQNYIFYYKCNKLEQF